MSAQGDQAPTAPTATLALRFFGRATAGLTHELKNCLAMINEFNGLIGDIIHAHERGQALNLERIKTLASDVRRHVVHGGEITPT